MRGVRDSLRAINPTMKPERAVTPLGDNSYFVLSSMGTHTLKSGVDFTLTSYKIIAHTLASGDLQIFLEYQYQGSWERFDFTCLEEPGSMSMEDTLPPEHVITADNFRIIAQGSCANIKIHCLIEGK